MYILPVDFMVSPRQKLNSKKSVNKIKFKASTDTITDSQKREANRQIDDIRSQIRDLDSTLRSDISQIDSEERQIKDDGAKQISALERQKDDLRNQTSKDKSTLQSEIISIQNQYHV